MGETSEKQKIRDRYKGVSQDVLEKIPAIEKKDIFVDESEKRVGVYARASTGDPRQTSSFELQQNHYTDLIDRRPGWHLYKIYADEGISGTSLKHREAFKEMIADCKEHKVDLIITKSVSRFARNIYDCIGYVRELAALKPPIGVLFETENLYTLKEGSEMSLSFIATLAQEESHTKSSSMNLSYEMRFSRGIFLTPELLGYDKDENGNLVINEDEALTVRLIFFMFLYGYSAQQIADTLMKLKRVTKRGNYKWTASTILSILQNERHCGDVLAHKTVTPNYLNHKSVPNRGERTQYRQKDHHEGIISRDDFIAAQQIISYSKGRQGMLPHIHVIDNGALKGFTIVNPRWAGFSGQDYLDAVEAIVPEFELEIQNTAQTMQVAAGSLDLRGFEVVRGQFFECGRTSTVTITPEQIFFSAGCLPKLDNCRNVELLFDPTRKLLVVRQTTKDNRNSIPWLYFDGRKYHPKKVNGRAFIPVIYQILKWNTNWPYYVRGECRENGTDSFLLFDLQDAEAVVRQRNRVIKVPGEAVEKTTPKTYEQAILAMPKDWLDSFGNDYYSQQSECLPANQMNVQDSGIPAPAKHPPGMTSGTELESEILSLIATMKEGETKDE